ncbi:MAG TPA: Ref family recombination enhancement nuclease [Scandinavium sp.]|jgi:hypothetical protein
MSKSKTKAEKLHLDRVAALGCVVCRNLRYGETPAETHHIRSGCGAGQRASHLRAIPLCPTHHRTGGFGIAIHAGQRTWEEKFGSEEELLTQTLFELGLIEPGVFYA